MHNLFLGTAKRMMEIWLELSILTRADLEHVQQMVDRCQVPSNFGRLPFKIAKSFSGFTAEQWKTWVTVFSPFALYSRLPADHYKCWLNFVQACKLLSQPMIKIADVGNAHSLLLKFCRGVERIYGTVRITPNMHMHSHLADCILDYGPVYSFWLFSFERYNGILGGYSTNNKSVELQLIRKFLRDQLLRDFELPEEYKDHFQEVMDRLSQRKSTQPNSCEIDCKKLLDILQMCDCSVDIENELWLSLTGYSLGLPHVIGQLDDDEHRYLTEVYKLFLPGLSANDVPVLFDKHATVDIAGERFGSKFSRLNRFAYILAKWVARFDGNIDLESEEERPGVIDCFMRQNISFGGKVYSFCFAYVRWFQTHPERFHCENRGLAPEIWCSSLFETLGPASFLPIQRISRKFIAGHDKVENENVLFVMPLQKRFLL